LSFRQPAFKLDLPFIKWYTCLEWVATEPFHPSYASGK
jgi:hypothetical protein